MLNLRRETSDAWVRCAVERIDDILLDHIHCEKKAAATAISLINRNPDKRLLVEKMAAHAVEEMEHFRLAHRMAMERGLALPRDPGDPYVQALLQHARREEPGRLLDALLVAGLIEARSCERFTLLAGALPDSDLRRMYHSLLASEAGHYTLFLSLAREYYPAAEVQARFDRLCEAEAAIVASLDPPGPTVHG